MSEAEMYYRQVNCLTVHEHPILGKKHHEVIEMMEDFSNHQTKLKNNEVLDLVSNTMLKTKCTKCSHVFQLKFSDRNNPHDTLKIGVGRDADVYEVEVECPKCDNIETVY